VVLAPGYTIHRWSWQKGGLESQSLPNLRLPAALTPAGLVDARGAWDAAFQKHQAHADDVRYQWLELTADGARLVAAHTTTATQKVRILDPLTGAEVLTFPVPKSLAGMPRYDRPGFALSPDGETLVSSHFLTIKNSKPECTLRAWDLRSGKERGAPISVPDRIIALAIAPDQQLYTAAMVSNRIVLTPRGKVR
jgi:hypothetical protein